MVWTKWAAVLIKVCYLLFQTCISALVLCQGFYMGCHYFSKIKIASCIYSYLLFENKEYHKCQCDQGYINLSFN